jgi:hypothetical protein
MSASSSRLRLSTDLREALRGAVLLKLPPGSPRTLDAIERATAQFLRELGPQLMEDVIEGVDMDPKKGALPSVAISPPTIKAS